MAIKRGTNSISRTHARNYTHEHAQKRLEETVAPFNQQVENSLRVDAVEIEYYQIQQKIGVPCTCEKCATSPIMHDGRDTNVQPVIPMKDDDSSGVHMTFQDDDIFGDSVAERIFNDSDDRVLNVSGDDTHFAHEIPDGPEGNEAFADGLAPGGSVNCGVCYRTGFQPPYKAYGKQRYLFTNYDIEQISGYYVNTTKAPHVIEKAAPDAVGFVMFKTVVPKYFKSVTVSIRDNLLLLLGEKLLRTDGQPMTVSDLRSYAGREVNFLVKCDSFTHIVLEFELDVPPLYANISGEQAALDYERLTTISDISVILPPSISQVEPGDILIVKNRNLVLKVRDKDVAQTATKMKLQWQISTRVLQPTEPLRNIANGFRMY